MGDDKLPVPYAVGYGTPPEVNGFQKGKSGNPGGRPKRTKAKPNKVNTGFGMKAAEEYLRLEASAQKPRSRNRRSTGPSPAAQRRRTRSRTSPTSTIAHGIRNSSSAISTTGTSKQRMFDLINEVVGPRYKAKLRNRSYAKGASQSGKALEEMRRSKQLRGEYLE